MENLMGAAAFFEGLDAEGVQDRLDEYATANREHGTNWTVKKLDTDQYDNYYLLLVRS